MRGNCDISSMGSNICGKLLSKQAIASPNNYVLNCAYSGNNSRYAVALSNHIVQVFENETLCAEYVHDKDVTSVKFSNREPSLLFSSSLDGKINVWDVRCKKPVQIFCDDSDGILKPLTCFDYNLNEELICGGTELIREDSFLLFWDRRSTETLGGYWNSHTDEITEVHFHPTVDSGMASSSVDGLINVFDLNAQTEDDALMHTLNIGSAVNTFCWQNSDVLSCTTTIEEFQLWSATEASPSLSMTREDLARNSQLQVDYLIDTIVICDRWFLVTGSYNGVIHLWNSDNEGLNAVCSLLKGHSDVVRTVCYCSKENVILTGGEDGAICKWKVESPR